MTSPGKTVSRWSTRHVSDDNHRDIAARYLSELAPDQRQPILDELEGRFRAEGKGMKPVYDEISFLHALCKQVEQGKFLAQPGDQGA